LCGESDFLRGNSNKQPRGWSSVSARRLAVIGIVESWSRSGFALRRWLRVSAHGHFCVCLPTSFGGPVFRGQRKRSFTVQNRRLRVTWTGMNMPGVDILGSTDSESDARPESRECKTGNLQRYILPIPYQSPSVKK